MPRRPRNRDKLRDKPVRIGSPPNKLPGDLKRLWYGYKPYNTRGPQDG